MKNGHILLIFLILLVALSALATTQNTPADDPKDDAYRKAEKILLTPLPGFDFHDSEYVWELELERRRRSPTGAMTRSLLVPGLGQFYNGKTIKGFVFIAAEVACVGLAISSYLTSRDYYNASLNESDESQRSILYDRYNDFLIHTELWSWLFIGFAAYSGMDAYVDAHLSDWEVDNIRGDEDAPEWESSSNGTFNFEWDVACGMVTKEAFGIKLTVSPF